MKIKRVIMILAVLALVLTCTTQTVSAGVEPSPFKGKTIGNRIQVARNQMVIMSNTLERFKARLNEIGYKGSLVAAENQINILQSGGRNTLRALESARGLYEQQGDDDHDYAQDLEDLGDITEGLVDEVLGAGENPLLSKEAKMGLRQLVSLLLGIENVIDSFFGVDID
jgi:hypothetical protein